MASKKISQLIKEGLFRGIGWAIGATIGFVIVSTIVVFVLRQIGGLPMIGGWFASIVDATLEQLAKRTPIVPQ